MRYSTAGESHGRALTAIVTRVPAGIPISAELIDADLTRRQGGYGRGGRQRIESDRVTILSGVRFGKTIGSPIALGVTNRDWDNWLDVMATSGDKPQGIALTQPRPGHADLAGVTKIASDDVRDVLERASARETAARVAAGGIAKAFLAAIGVSVRSFVTSIGDASVEWSGDVSAVDNDAVEASDVRCPDAAVSQRMRDLIDDARSRGESLGGTFVVVAEGVVPGVGSYAEADLRLDSALAAAVISIPAIKGVEFGTAFRNSALPGSIVHDEITWKDAEGYARNTNRAGGLEGGMSNGEPIVVHAAMKPIPTLMRPLGSVDICTHEPVDASKERSDVCAVPAAAVVAESEVAFAIARSIMRKFGGDNVSDIRSAIDHYRERLG